MKKIAVLKAPGTNNDYETLHAVEISKGNPELIHMNQFLRGEKKLRDYGALIIPGGFSYGDDISAGKVLSFFFEFKLREQIIKFIEKGKQILGICNGFQVLVKAKFLPFISENQLVTLAENNIGHFLCKWCRLKILNNKKTHWFNGLPDEIELPIAHAEGRFLVKEELKKDIGKFAVLKYVKNPNGSFKNIAGITNLEGNILGIMPHPERYMYSFQNPSSRFNGNSYPWGRVIFKNLVKNV